MESILIPVSKAPPAVIDEPWPFVYGGQTPAEPVARVWNGSTMKVLLSDGKTQVYPIATGSTQAVVRRNAPDPWYVVQVTTVIGLIVAILVLCALREREAARRPVPPPPRKLSLPAPLQALVKLVLLLFVALFFIAVFTPLSVFGMIMLALALPAAMGSIFGK